MDELERRCELKLRKDQAGGGMGGGAMGEGSKPK